MHKDTAKLAAAFFGKAVRISPEGEVDVIDFADYPSTLEALQKGVEGTIDIVRCEGLDLWLNDEGMYTHADQPNRAVTVLAMRLGSYDPGFIYRGPAVLAESNEEGETIPLGAEQSVRVAAALLEMSEG